MVNNGNEGPKGGPHKPMYLFLLFFKQPVTKQPRLGRQMNLACPLQQI